MNGGPLTVSVTTRSRPGPVERCILSLASIRDLVDSAIVFDDASAPPLDIGHLTRATEAVGVSLEVLRADARILRELARSAPAILRQRHPVRWRTVREWRRLRAFTPPYSGALAR
jgi:hypothetical protein